ncbi:TPA: hypothetical protein ACP4Y0_005222, partial [Escherichia coli]
KGWHFCWPYIPPGSATETTNTDQMVISEIPRSFLPRFYVSTSKSIIKALINMHSFEIQLSPIG